MSSSLFFLGWPDAADLSSHAAYQLRRYLRVGKVRIDRTSVLLELNDAGKKCCADLGHCAVSRDKQIVGLHLNVVETLRGEVIHHGLYLRGCRRVGRHELAHRKRTAIKRTAGIVD